MTSLLVLLLAAASPEAELLEDDVVLPADFTWSEVMQNLRSHPLDINRATPAELLQVPFLTPSQVQVIVTYREETGRIRDPMELAGRPGFDSARIRQIGPYLGVPASRSKSHGYVTIRAMCDSLGSADRSRRLASTEELRAEFGDFAAALTARKDAGETDYLDFVGGGLQYRHAHTSVLAGDYDLSAGQGLVLARPGAFLSLVGMSRVPPLPAGGLPATSENARFQGLDVTQEIGRLDVEAFVARNHWDAVPNADSTIRTIIYDRIHDDSAAEANRNRLREDLAGGRVGVELDKFRMNLNGYANAYDHLIRPASATGFDGNHLSVVSFDLAGQFVNYTLGFEAANSLGHGWAGALDLLGDWENLQTHLNLAYLQSDFYSPHSRSRTLQRSKDDLAGNFRASYRWLYWRFSAYAATAEDFISDSTPARLEFGVENRSTPFRIGLRWKQGFAGESLATGGARLDAGYLISPLFTISGRYEDRFSYRNVTQRKSLFEIGARYSDGKFDLSLGLDRPLGQPGDQSIYVYEDGFPGNNTAFSGTAWRGYLTGSVLLGPHYRVGFKFGAARAVALNFDGGLWLQAGFSD